MAYCQSKQEAGTKFDAGKLRWDLIPPSMSEVVFVYTYGATKYADRNWEKGMAWGRMFAAMMRHAWDFWWAKTLGKSTRHEGGMHMLGSVVFYALGLMEYERLQRGTDDRAEGGDTLHSMQQPLAENGRVSHLDGGA